MEHTPGLPPELQAPAADVVDSHAPAPSPRGRGLRTAGIVATGVVAGALGVAVLQSGGSSASTLTGAGGPAAGQLGGAPTGPQGAGQAGPDQRGFPGGGADGETLVRGTVTAVSASSITLRADDGTTTTVPVTGTTEVVVDGSRATLGDVEAGDVAMVHVVPDGSGTVAERVLVGFPNGAGFGPPPGGSGPVSST